MTTTMLIIIALAITLLAVGTKATVGDMLLPEVTPENLPFMDNSSEEEVLVLRKPPPGYEPATTEAEWQPVFEANLFRDLRRYQRKIDKAGGQPLSLAVLRAQMEALRRRGRRWKQCVLVVIRNGVIYAHLPSNKDKEIVRRARLNLAALAEGAVRLRLQLPDTIYIFNLYDEPVCRAVGGCVVPVFSMHKRFNTTLDRSYDSDVLLPHLGHSYDKLYFFPWHQKDPRAMMRSTMQATMRSTCARMQLARLSASPPGAQLMDIGFSSNKNKRLKLPQSYMRPYIGMSRHALYKFLINADGHVSSSRLGYIMQTNSVLLKQRSPWIEYYYRSLVPERHMLEYTPEGVLGLLRKYQDPALDGELRQLANASQHFCAKYLTTDGKVRYTARALHEYSRLFGPALGAFVRQLRGLTDLSLGLLPRPTGNRRGGPNTAAANTTTTSYSTGSASSDDPHDASAAAAGGAGSHVHTGGMGGGAGGGNEGGGGNGGRMWVAIGQLDFERLMGQLRKVGSGRRNAKGERSRAKRVGT